jgi:hypothetical protein
MSAPDSVDVPDTVLGETTDLSVLMQAPGQPGTYKGYWQMQGPDGRHFGDQAYVLIAVGTAEVAPTPAAGVGTGTAQGRVLWNEQPFAGVTVKLCADWGMFGGCKGTEYQAVTDTDGRYTITGIPPGEYDFVTKLPDQPNETGWLGLSVTVQADQTVTVRDVPVVKYDLKLLSPADKTTVNTTTPALTWESYPGAAYYKVYVSGGPSSKTAVSFEKTTATQYNVTTPLESGEYYWRITAYNASGSEIAENGRLSYFTVAP